MQTVSFLAVRRFRRVCSTFRAYRAQNAFASAGCNVAFENLVSIAVSHAPFSHECTSGDRLLSQNNTVYLATRANNPEATDLNHLAQAQA